MTEQYGFKFVVDANDAARGWKQFESAVDGVFNALDRMESHVAKSMASLKKNMNTGRADLTAFNKAVKDLGSVKISGSSSKNITTLSAAMRGFKAPSAAQVKNTTAFFRALEKSGVGGGAAAAKNIAAINAAMRGFKAPSASNVRNLRDLFLALAAFPRNGGLTNAAGMFASLRQLQGFKAPSATQVKNLQAFLNTVANLRIPQNGAQVARSLEQIARASTAANTHLRGLRGSIGSINWNRFNTGARSASINMMGLQNAFSATYQMGSILRSLLGSLTIAELGRGFFEATNRVVSFKASMKVVSDEAGYANQELSFLTDTALRLGLDYGKAAESYGKFAISVNKAGGSAADARNIFEGFGTAMSVMGLAADKQNDVMLALQQSMNKGYVAGEELNQQLNEHLPGALGYLRAELEKSGITLEKALKNKMLDATKTLNFLANQYRNDFGPSVAEALERPAAQANIFRTNITKLFEAIAENGGNQAFVDLLKQINGYFQPDDIQRYAKAIGESLKNAVDKVAAAFKWLHDNWDSIKGPLATTLILIGKLIVLQGSLQLGRYLIQPLLLMGAALGPMKQASLYLRAITATNFGGFRASLVGMSTATLDSTRKFITFRAAVMGIPAAMRSAAAGTSAMTLAMNGMRGAVGVAATGFKGLINLLGGPVIVGMAAVAYGIYAIMDAINEQDRAFNSSKEILSEVDKTMREYREEVFRAQVENMGLTKALSESGKAMKDANTDARTLIGGLFGVASAAQNARVELLRMQLTKLQSARDDIHGQTASGRWENQKKLLKSGTGIPAAIWSGVKGVGTSTFGEHSDADLLGQQQLLDAKIAEKQRDISSAFSITGFNEAQQIEQAKRRALEGASSAPSDLLREGTTADGKKKRKGRTPRTPDPEREAERLRRKVDDIMRRLGEDNPLLKLQHDFVSDMTRQAETLLTDGGLDEWMKQIGENGADVETSLGDLQDAMRGAGVDQKVLDDLALRYGVTVDDLTDSMTRQLTTYREARREAKIDEQFGGRLLKNKTQELQMARLSANQQEVLSQVIEEVNRAKGTALEYDQESIDLLTKKLTLQQEQLELLDAERRFYENNGLKAYHADLRTAGELVHDLDKDFLGSVEDTLTRLGTTGKFSLKGIIDTVQQGLVKWSSQGITDAIGGMLSDKDSNNPTIFGGLMRAMGFGTGFDKDKAMERINAQNVVLYAARVNTQGDLFGAGFGIGNSPAGNNSGDIVVNALKEWNLDEELARPLLSATDQVGQAMSQDWSQKIHGLGGLLQSVFAGGSGGGGGGLFGGLLNVGMSLLGGGGGLGSLMGASNSMIAANPGIFKEGGVSTQPVARWRSAPHYSEGTHNTSPGMPAYLHNNEAVIPLSRGRKVPVELTSGGNGGSGTNITNVWNVTSPNVDSFKRSQQQITGQMHRAATRAYARNN